MVLDRKTVFFHPSPSSNEQSHTVDGVLLPGSEKHSSPNGRILLRGRRNELILVDNPGVMSRRYCLK